MSIEEDEIIDHDYKAIDRQQEEIMQRETARTNLERLRNLRRLIIMVTGSIVALAILFFILAYATRQLWYEPVDKLITEDFPPKEVVLKIDGADELIAKMITPEDMQNIIAQEIISALEPELERIRLTRSNLESVADQVRESNKENQNSISDFIATSKENQDKINDKIEKNENDATERAKKLLKELEEIKDQSASSDKDIANQVEKSIQTVIEKVKEVETVVQKELSTIETQKIIERKLQEDFQKSNEGNKSSYIIQKDNIIKYNEEIFSRSYSHWKYPISIEGTFEEIPDEQYCNFHFVKNDNSASSYITAGRINSEGNYTRADNLVSSLQNNKLSQSLSEKDYKDMECHCNWYSNESIKTGPKHCKNN